MTTDKLKRFRCDRPVAGPPNLGVFAGGQELHQLDSIYTDDVLGDNSVFVSLCNDPDIEYEFPPI